MFTTIVVINVLTFLWLYKQNGLVAGPTRRSGRSRIAVYQQAPDNTKGQGAVLLNAGLWVAYLILTT